MGFEEKKRLLTVISSLLVIILLFSAPSFIHSFAFTDRKTAIGQGRFHSTRAISVELLGASGYYAYQFSKKLSPDWAVNIGFSYIFASGFSEEKELDLHLVQFPLSISRLFGRTGHYLEVLAGGDLIWTSLDVNDAPGVFGRLDDVGLIPQIGIGYRYWPSEGGFYFRAVFYVFLHPENVFPWGGLSFGMAF